MSVLSRRRGQAAAALAVAEPAAAPPTGCVPIAEVAWRHRARVHGRVRSVRVQPWGGVPTLECRLVDESGGLIVVFLGRRAVAGIEPGRHVIADGMVGAHHGRLAMINPDYELRATGE